MKIINWTHIYIVFLLKITVLVGLTISWTHVEKSYKGNCQEDHNQGEECPDLGEHAYKGELVDESPKGPRYYIDDLEPYYDDNFNFERQKRASKKKESKVANKTPKTTKIAKDVDEDIDDSEDLEEERIEKPVKKTTNKNKDKKKKLDANMEKKGEDDDDDEDDEDEGNDNESDESRMNEEENTIENYRSDAQ